MDRDKLQMYQTSASLKKFKSTYASTNQSTTTPLSRRSMKYINTSTPEKKTPDKPYTLSNTQLNLQEMRLEIESLHKNIINQINTQGLYLEETVSSLAEEIKNQRKSFKGHIKKIKEEVFKTQSFVDSTDCLSLPRENVYQVFLALYNNSKRLCGQ
jgi:hypothetical protein